MFRALEWRGFPANGSRGLAHFRFGSGRRLAGLHRRQLGRGGPPHRRGAGRRRCVWLEFRFRHEHLAGNTVDVITDFQRGTDMINLRTIDANTLTKADDAFRFIGKGDFSGKAGELRFTTIDGAAHVYGDIDGDGIADFTVVVNGVPTVTANDFHL